MGIPDHLTCLLIDLYAGQEATVRKSHGTIDWFKIGKGVQHGRILSPCLCAEFIMQNAGLHESQAGIKFAGRNINNLRYADDITLIAKIKKMKRNEGASWLRVKEENEKAGLKLSIQKTKIMASVPITS